MKLLLQYIFLICIISIFIPLNFIYPIFFCAYIFICIIYIISNIKHLKMKTWQMFLLFFLGWGICLSIKGIYDRDAFFKLIMNLTFLFVSGFCLQDFTGVYFIKKLYLVIKIIIILTFIQLCFSYLQTGFFLLVLKGGIENSSIATQLTDSIVLFGNTSKNIWASKILLIQLVFLFMTHENTIGNKHSSKFELIIFICLANIIMVLGRTSQVAFLIAFMYFIIKRYIYKKSFLYIISVGVILLVAFAFGVVIFINKFMHITMDVSDGGYVRLIYWEVFFRHIIDTNYIIGNGILYTKNFLSKYSSFYIGESNMHNVFLNTWLDFGIIGVSAYFSTLISLFFNVLKKLNIFPTLFIFILPFLVIISLQYLGYDNDLIIFLSLIIICSNYNNINISVK